MRRDALIALTLFATMPLMISSCGGKICVGTAGRGVERRGGGSQGTRGVGGSMTEIALFDWTGSPWFKGNRASGAPVGVIGGISVEEDSIVFMVFPSETWLFCGFRGVLVLRG